VVAWRKSWYGYTPTHLLPRGAKPAVERLVQCAFQVKLKRCDSGVILFSEGTQRMSTTLQNSDATLLGEVINSHEAAILEDWIKEMSGATRRTDLLKDAELRAQCTQFLRSVRAGVDSGNLDLGSPGWKPICDFLADISRSRAQQGFTPSETATFVFSVKRKLFSVLRDRLGSDANALASALWTVTELIDSLGLYTAEVYLKSRADIIRRQQEEMLELSTPVVKLWHGILALPIIGTLDSQRTQVVMEALLEGIVKTNSKVAIIDITGVPTVDTLVAQHLLKTVTAARLMGADCIISGVRPQIAQTIVHLGINLSDVTTKATLSDAFALALQRTGMTLEHGNNAKPRGA
jgi:rsbT co-antagonist protein RsbR